MENKLNRNHTRICMSMTNPQSHPPSLGMHKDSQTISRTKPKIRIIHIFAPKIIKTDVENFRELVQKLTGKPSGEKHCNIIKKPRSAGGRSSSEQDQSRSTNSSGSGLSEKPGTMSKKTEQLIRKGIGGFWRMDQLSRDRSVKEEEEGLCSTSDESSSGGYLGGFSDLGGFISELGEFPLLPLGLDGSHVQGLI